MSGSTSSSSSRTNETEKWKPETVHIAAWRSDEPARMWLSRVHRMPANHAQNIPIPPAIPHLVFACVGERPILDAEGLATPFATNT
jgi:hypothetical protein